MISQANGLTARAIAEMGGEVLAATWPAEMQWHHEGEALAASVGKWTEERHVHEGYVWHAPEGGFCATGLCPLWRRWPLSFGRIKALAARRRPWSLASLLRS